MTFVCNMNSNFIDYTASCKGRFVALLGWSFGGNSFFELMKLQFFWSFLSINIIDYKWLENLDNFSAGIIVGLNFLEEEFMQHCTRCIYCQATSYRSARLFNHRTTDSVINVACVTRNWQSMGFITLQKLKFVMKNDQTGDIDREDQAESHATLSSNFADICSKF